MKFEIITNNDVTWQEVKALRLEAVKNYPASFAGSYEEDKSHSDAYWEDLLKRDRMKHVFARLENGELIGSVSFYYREMMNVRHLYRLCAMYVKPESQGKGVGKKLVLTALNQIKKDPIAHKVALSVELSNVSAVKLYESCGFKSVGIQKDELKVEGVFYDELMMELIL